MNPSMGRIDCPGCGRPDTGVTTNWRMNAHGRGPLRVVNQHGHRERERCPGADPARVFALFMDQWLQLPAPDGAER